LLKRNIKLGEDIAEELLECQKAVASEHEEDFKKALHQATLLFNIPDNDKHIDVNKDVHQKALFVLRDITTSIPRMMMGMSKRILTTKGLHLIRALLLNLSLLLKKLSLKTYNNFV